MIFQHITQVHQRPIINPFAKERTRQDCRNLVDVFDLLVRNNTEIVVDRFKQRWQKPGVGKQPDNNQDG